VGKDTKKWFVQSDTDKQFTLLGGKKTIKAMQSVQHKKIFWSD